MQTCFRTTAIGLTLAGWLGLGADPGLRARPSGALQPDPCAAPANAVVAENCRPGNPRVEWDVNGAGDPEIQGFATEMSVNRGETVEFKIRTHSPRYRIDIYRMGWYGGDGARRVDTIRPSVALPQAQPDCRIHTGMRFVDCGNWRVSAGWSVPADAVSGVYVARLVREDDEPEPWTVEGERGFPTERPPAGPHAYGALGLGALRDALVERRASHIIFVVRDDDGGSDVLVQTSDPTWVAFNRYGGASLYGAWSAVGPGGDERQRGYMASYNRPLTNREDEIPDQFFNAEYPLVRWLERNGYDVGYIAGVDTDRRGERLQDHRVFISAGHDAYWSGAQREHITAARDAGVHLIFLSGGTGMWKARYRPSMAGPETPYRTLVSFRETLAHGKLDPMPDVWTGTWRDSRPFNPEGARPENALTGTIATVAGLRNDRLQVPGRYGRLRFWRDTSLTTLDEGDVVSLGRGVLGHEWGQDLDNGVRPEGLIHLSETTVDNVAYVQDWGSIYDSGSATHHLTLYRAPGGALVFSAGSAQYAWGLDDLHTYFTTPSGRVRPDPMGAVPPMQQATVNLLADMGVQPASLQPDLQPATPSQDTLGPVARVDVPLDGAVVDGMATVTGTASDRDGVVAAVEVSTDGGATWHPAMGTDRWRYAWRIASPGLPVRIVARAVDDSGWIGPVSPAVLLHARRPSS